MTTFPAPMGNSAYNISKRFSKFLENIRITEIQTDDGKTKYKGVTSKLNTAYYGNQSEDNNAFLVGSWGKFTRVRPPRDVDLYFILPYEVYTRFQGRTGNKQSQILQEVKGHLSRSYPSTDVKGDGPIVLIPFITYNVEVVPAFRLDSGKYWICDTKNGGSYKISDPKAEILNISNEDNRTKGNLRALIRMAKCWQNFCNVPVKSFYLELLAIQFLTSWEYFDRSTSYYDWMVRDFMKFLQRDFFVVVVPGTNEVITVRNTWNSKAETAYNKSLKAIGCELKDETYMAGLYWQDIFGTSIPASI